MWDPKERGAPRWEPPHGKMSSDSPRPAVLWIRDRRCCCCRPWVSAAPREGKAGQESGWGFTGQHLTATAWALSCVPHARGCNLAWRGPALGGHAAQWPTRSQRHRPPGLTTRHKRLQMLLGRSAQPGVSALPSPWGPCPFPYLAHTAALGEMRVTPRRISIPRASATPAPEAPTGTHNCPRVHRLTTQLPG